MDQPFVGRQNELALLRTRLEATRGGRSQIVLVAGVAGIGKTALLQAFFASTHYLVVGASGDNLETGLPYGVTEQLASGLPQPVPEWLTKLGTERATRAHPVQIGAGLVDLLGCLQAKEPVIIVIDDAHWADQESLQALAFALRRLRGNQVLTLLAAREDLLERLPASLHRLVAGPAGARLRLGGLDVGELRELSLALQTGPLSKRAATRLRDHTGGNPLHARTLLEELPTNALHDNGRPLPAPRSFRKLVLARLAACPADAESLVVAAAVLGTQCSLAVASRLAEVDDPLPALERAIHARLLEERPTSAELLIAFPHPLVHAAVYHDLGPARRAALHARAARLVSSEPAAVRHRVAAASGPDPALTTRLITLAGQQALAGAWTAGAEALLSAARLSPTQEQRKRLILQAIDHMLLSGNGIDAVPFANELATFGDRAQQDYVAARLATVTGRHPDAERLLTHAWQHILETQAELAAAIAEQLALRSLLHAHGEQAVTWAQRALAALPSNPLILSNLNDILTVGLVMAGRPTDALDMTASLPNPAETPSPAGLDGWIGRSIARAWTDDLSGAHMDLTQALAAYRDQGGPLPWALGGLAFLADIEYRMGAWDDAIAHAELAVTLARDTEEDQAKDWLATFVHAVAAFPLAARGAHERAAAHVSAAVQHLELAGSEQGASWVATAQALLALADGDDQRIVAALEPLSQLPASAAEPGWYSWPALYAEGLVGLGRNEHAQTTLVPFEARAAACRRRSAQAAAARARGRLEAALGHPKRAETAYQVGLEHVRGLPLLFDRALLEAAYGRFLRRIGRRAEAVVHLKAARTQLARLDARPYLQRCDHELAACNHPTTPRQPGPPAMLTPQELTVARLVAAGRSNRQAAAELVVSVKTIEYHLSNAYAKLAVTSRTQLALALGQDQGNP
jgi:ATP/maltotriose-dependent transcriptional regulator MalT